MRKTMMFIAALGAALAVIAAGLNAYSGHTVRVVYDVGLLGLNIYLFEFWRRSE